MVSIPQRIFRTRTLTIKWSVIIDCAGKPSRRRGQYDRGLTSRPLERLELVCHPCRKSYHVPNDIQFPLRIQKERVNHKCTYISQKLNKTAFLNATRDAIMVAAFLALYSTQSYISWLLDFDFVSSPSPRPYNKNGPVQLGGTYSKAIQYTSYDGGVHTNHYFLTLRLAN